MILERAARLSAIGIIAFLLWSSLRPARGARAHEIHGAELASRLGALVRDPALTALHVRVDSSLGARDIAALVALRRAGVRVGWSGDVPALALSVSRVAEPGSALRVLTAAPADARVVVADRVGVLDSVLSRGGGAQVEVPTAELPVRARVGAYVVETPSVDSLVLRPVLVVGRAGWEAKFVVAALEERGWKVATRLTLAPGIAVTQGDAGAVDTARFSAVVVLDTSVSRLADELRRYVRRGGGVVLAGGASAHPAFASLAPARTGARIAARPRLVADSISAHTLSRVTLAALQPRGVALDRSGGEIFVAARREGLGRVLQMGVDETWRWRMEGAEGSEENHRRFWSRLVASVAYAGLEPSTETSVAHLPAARAAMIDRLGAPSAPVAAAQPFDPLRHTWALAIVLALLTLEWFSRRLRGAR